MTQEPTEENPRDVRRNRRDAWRGVRAISPLLPGILPFAMVAGSTAIEIGLSVPKALGMSIILFAGASQLVMLEMWEREAPALVLLATVLLVNLRFTMYSATMAPYVTGLKWHYRALMAYPLTDQAALLSLPRFKKDPASAVWFYAGAAATMWICWQIGTVVGIVAGSGLPEDWPLDFAVPLSFLALMIPAIKDRGTAVAAVTAGLAVLFTRLLPLNLGLIVASLIGVGAGMAIGRRRS